MKRRNFINIGTLLGFSGIAAGCSAINTIEKEEKSIPGTACVLDSVRKGRKIKHRIVATGDGHWMDNHISTAHKRLGKWANNISHEERHNRMIDWMNQETDGLGTDFIVFNGDLVTNKPELLPKIKTVYDQAKAKYYVTHGNHDHSNERDWQNLWGYPMNHSFTFGDYAVLLLNSSDEKGTYLSADPVWLKKHLELYKDKKGILVFCHICQHLNRTGTGVEAKEVTELLLNANNVKCSMYSHSHLYNSNFPIFKSLDDGGRRLETFFTGHFSAWGLPYLGYRVIEIYEDEDIATYAYNPESGEVYNWNIIPRVTI